MSLASEIAADSPAAVWWLEETSGTTLVDSSGNGRDGTIDAGVTLNATGIVPNRVGGGAWDLDGVEGGEVATGTWADSTTGITAEVWVRFDTLASEAVVMARSIVSAANSRANKAWAIQVNTNGAVLCRFYTNSNLTAVAQSSNGVITTGTLYHIAFVHDTTGGKFYVNGTQVASTAATGGPVTYANNTRPIAIGRQSQASTYSLDGRVQAAAYYTTALTQTRLAAHYSAGASASSPTTVDLGKPNLAITAYSVTATVGTVQALGKPNLPLTAYSVTATVGAVVDLGTPNVPITAYPVGIIEGIVRNLTAPNLPITAYGITASVGATVDLGKPNLAITAYSIDLVDGTVVDLGKPSLPITVRAVTVQLGYATTRRDVTNGRNRGGIAYASWLPAVVPTPPHLSGVGGAGGAGYAQAVDKALAFGPVTVTGTQPRFAATGSSDPHGVTVASVPRHRDRVIVGGRDVTYFRGAEVRVGNYQLMEPFGYGTAVLEFPQVYPEYEAIGVGDLAWLAPGSPVLIQRVDAAGNVVATDYKGVLTSPNANTGTFTYEVGGEVTGPASLRHRPMPLFRVVEDIGRQLARALGFVGVRTPRLGPDTGIELARVGDMSLLEYMQQLVGRAWTRGGNQWTVMPDDQGVYRIARKDRATIAGTVYLSASSAEADLRRDIAEEPNRIFGTGVTPAGKRIRNGRYPGLDIDNADKPAFPGTLSEGATGDGVLALIRQLQVQGYLNAETAPGGFDEDVVEAVRSIQEDAGLSVTGTVNSATWDAIYDNTAQGASLSLSRIEPLAQKGYTKQYRYSASGAIIGRNPNYDPTRLKIDRMVDYGTGFTKKQMVEWSKAELVEAAEANWVGTLTIHSGAVVAGDHTPGDPIGGVLPARDIKPGMNLSLPQFQGGIVVHVTAAQVTGDVVTLQVDTRARDAWNVAQVIERNRESRRDPARAFFRQLASSQAQKDAIEEWSEVGGLIADHDLVGGEWNIIEVVGGQAGTVRSIRYETNPNAESSVAVFGKRVWPKALQQTIGNPLTEEGAARWQDEDVRRRLERDHGLLYSAGDNVEPGGYSPGYKTGTSSIFTGRFEDDASFAYYTDTRPILYVAVWVDRDCTIPGGRIMWPQLESGA